MSKTCTKYDKVVPPEFEWPEYNSDRERIKALSKKYENVSIAEAFAMEYGLSLNKTSEEGMKIEYVNTHPVAIGEIINVTIDSISKNYSVVSYHNSKDLFTIKQNISSWNVRPGDELRVSVIEKGKNGFVVDCIDPIFQDWLRRVNSTLTNNFQSFRCTVHDLQRQPGGYTGKVSIPEISKLTGKPYTIDAFIPGSYIALNIEKDFEKWNGETVEAMITNFTQRNGNFSVVCSRKKLLNTAGGTSMVNIYDAGYCHGGESNAPFDKFNFEGRVTGIINSATKHGVFVEVPEFNITGLVEKNPRELVNYHEGDEIKVRLDHFDWDQKKQPYRRDRDGILTEVNLRPVFVEVA